MDIVPGHEESIVPAGEFKQRCLALLDQVAETGTPILVTKHGRAVARVVPVQTSFEALRGSVETLTDNDEELFSTGDIWEAEHSG